MTKVTPAIGKFASNGLELASYVFTVPQLSGVGFFSHGLQLEIMCNLYLKYI